MRCPKLAAQDYWPEDGLVDSRSCSILARSSFLTAAIFALSSVVGSHGLFRYVEYSPGLVIRGNTSSKSLVVTYDTETDKSMVGLDASTILFNEVQSFGFCYLMCTPEMARAIIKR
jgi:hypothetical protein